ncbi:MAG: hypothetical protein WCT44_00920 [Candidatus Paceibacterota bacterium]
MESREPIATEKTWFERLKLWITGIGSYYVITYLYDYVVVSFLLIYLGFVEGIVVVMILSMLIDFWTLKFYDWFKKDWLALETLKDLQYRKNFIGKLFNFVQNKSTFVTIVVLSLTSNAFIVTAYMRKGSFKYDGLTKRDWLVFLSSSLLTNLYWVFLIAGGIEIVKYSYQAIINYINVI